MKQSQLCSQLVCGALLLALGQQAVSATALPVERGVEQHGYVAKQDGLRTFFDAISSRLKKPIILSKLAVRKQVSGEFDLVNPQALLEQMTQQLGLIWYHDGQTIYVYDASETRNSVVALRNLSLSSFNAFLRKSGLYDRRYPLRGDERSGTFYVSGPPVYVDLVLSAAKFMDSQRSEIDGGRLKIGVVRLNNTFVGDRSYELRDQKITIPGMASVIISLLQDEKSSVDILAAKPVGAVAPSMPDFPTVNKLEEPVPYKSPMSLPDALKHAPSAGNIRVIANPDTNSLLVKGTAEQVRFIENLVAELDVAKRHVELSLWIIDLQKDDLDQLGVNWQGSLGVGNQLGVSFNNPGSFSTLDGTRFMASILALSQDKKANVVSRPVVLTQENVPALFDNSRTFYTQLIGERSVELQHVTYGTLVNVLPRFSADGQIEMSLNIEDGSEVPQGDSETKTVLPTVGRTRISTVARVPKDKSLLIGGYTRDASTDDFGKIPLLGELPFVGDLFRYQQRNSSNLVRVFLIQPRQIEEPAERDASDLAAGVISQADSNSAQQAVRKYMDRSNGDQ
ncbi:type III secretion system outer membrane ring subunit SctC [Iodobacter fluviatilis]|uniref:Type 3 secretion system secretin n=1 Tax=Iodobacter fluviatilis TaxID=537 RepID=A0A377Q4L6_9NEIS|nr:type III secretion system outer membrane ring subunit SctC [Iodobacter fluviatilis]TCU86885.1 type III secretion protein C [Iodobacter fluviatilis]STQ90216.1 type III secretion system outer membrane pore InvG [Iodobacter fluviatilis]